mmetsp:Transcript_30044/g.47114  ORF Transcript_30044/g.47114 Transcript_30044/m.47114 type:complete len:84 (-) Transcript_30044:2295-2546(-)
MVRAPSQSMRARFKADMGFRKDFTIVSYICRDAVQAATGSHEYTFKTSPGADNAADGLSPLTPQPLSPGSPSLTFNPSFNEWP